MGAAQQGEVAGVQGAHRGHQAQALPGAADGGGVAAEGSGGGKDLHGFGAER